MKQNDFEITISLKEQPFGTGMPAGALGSIIPPASHDAAGWLAQRGPVEVDKAAVLLVRQHGANLFVASSLFPRDPYQHGFPRECVLSGEVDYVAIAASVRPLLTPAPVEEIEGWLAELALITRRRPETDFEGELRLTAYSTRLARYPADVARYATLEKVWPFWPSWYELKAVCDDAVAFRRLLIAALEQGPDPDPEEKIRSLREGILGLRTMPLQRELGLA